MTRGDLRLKGLYIHRRRGTYCVVEIIGDNTLYYRIKFTKRRRWIEIDRFLREWKPLQESTADAV